jgi:hypothetical protein
VGWQRFNRNTNIFEVSDNNGSTWIPLVIAAAGVNVPPPTKPNLPASIAYEDEANIFAEYQTILTKPGSGDATLYFKNTAVAAGSQVFRLLNYTGRFRIWNEAGGEVFSVDQTGATYIQLGVLTTQHIVAAGNIHNSAGYMYPGNVSGSGSLQSTWYLSSHSSYGLYSNTGLYLENYVWTLAVEGRAHIRAAGGLYDYARGTPIGNWIDYLPTWQDTAGRPITGTIRIHYTLIGKLMIVNYYCTPTLQVQVPDIMMTLPINNVVGNGGLYAARGAMNWGGSWQYPILAYAPGNGWLYLIRSEGIPTTGSTITGQIMLNLG